MDLQNAPSFISAKMAALSDARARAHVRADELVREIADLRDRFNGRVQRADDSRTDFPKLLNEARAEQSIVSTQLAALTHVCDACRSWLASLPSNVSLETVSPEIPTGITLPALRAQIQTLEASVAALRRVPTPAPDIEQKVRNYISSLTQPVIRGVAAGEQLSVTWPGAPSQYAAIPPTDWFVMAAFLEPEKFAARLLDAINKQAPPTDRDQNITQLEREIEQLQRVEEVLVVSTGATRISGRLVQAVLGCRVSSTSRSKQAA